MTDCLSRDYEERVYAGVLGKIIGVYLGRPFEGWTNARIERELGEITGYVHEKFNAPLIVTDDDISGTFTFLRALSENGNAPDLTPAQIGDWWRNSIIENRTVLWWGGLGVSTEHTAYLRLKEGRKAPASGSIHTNGTLVAEQIGAQIFIDGWGLICPGDAERAADFAKRAASVSHDGEAIYGAQVIAALIAQAFIERDLHTMLDTAVSFIPRESVIARLINDVRTWANDNGDDWRCTFRQIQSRYGYDKYGGGCHIVPNHAVIMLALLHGNGDFGRSLMIANTAGWDTDCNSGNVGCILGVWQGLAAIDAANDLRSPVADRLYLPTADGGRAITDALRETYAIVNTTRALSGETPVTPKNDARFHFTLPGSVQGFTAKSGGAKVENSHSSLRLRLTDGQTARISTPTFTPPETLSMGGYALVASPTLYAGQTVTAQVNAGEDLSAPVNVNLFISVYDKDDHLALRDGPIQAVSPNGSVILEWTLPDTDGQPIAEIGIAAAPDESLGSILLDWLTWEGTPDTTLGKPTDGGTVWPRAWVNGADHFTTHGVSDGMTYRIIQNDGTGLVTQGESCWTDYTVSTTMLPHLCCCAGLIACAQGLRRYVALLLDSDTHIRLIEHRDDDLRMLAEAEIIGEYEKPLDLEISITGNGITARVGSEALTASGENLPKRGAIGLLTDTGHAEFGVVPVRPA